MAARGRHHQPAKNRPPKDRPKINRSGDGRVCLGAIAGAYGVRGAVRIKSFTAEPKDIAAYGPLSDESGERVFEIRVTGMSKSQVLAEIEGIADRGAAEALKGTRLYVPRARLPAPEEEEYYHDDLIGLAVELTDGTALGTVVAVHDFGAGDVIEVGRDGGAAVLVPFTRAVVPVVDIANRRLVIDPPPGLLDPIEPGPGDREDDGDEI